jgi:deoxyribonuclease-4
MREEGWMDVKLGLETTGKKFTFGTLEEIVNICKEVKGCIPVVDFAHLFARDGGKIDYPKIFEGLKPLKLKHLHTHYTSVLFNSKGEVKHLTWKVQKPPFLPLAKEILKRKLDITVISESPTLEQDSLEQKKVFEKLGHHFS